MFQMYGVVPPMLTPFQENGEVDYESLKTLVNFLSTHVNGLFINGSYGGGVLMTEEERRQVAETTIDTAAGRVPVIVQVGTADSLSAARLVDHAASAGAWPLRSEVSAQPSLMVTLGSLLAAVPAAPSAAGAAV